MRRASRGPRRWRCVAVTATPHAPGAPPTLSAISPPPPQWQRALNTPVRPALPRELARAAASFRDELGLPAGRPLAMTGHQAIVWHAGILAKYLALDAACVRSGADGAWLVVDQDEAEFDQLRVPVRDAGGSLGAVVWRLAPTPPPAVSAASCSAFTPEAFAPGAHAPALESVARGAERIRSALAAHTASSRRSAAARRPPSAGGDSSRTPIHRPHLP